MSKKNTGLDFLEDPDALENKLEDVGDFFEQNRNIVLGVVGGLVLLLVGFFGYRAYVSSQDETAQIELFPESLDHMKMVKCILRRKIAPKARSWQSWFKVRKLLSAPSATSSTSFGRRLCLCAYPG